MLSGHRSRIFRWYNSLLDYHWWPSHSITVCQVNCNHVTKEMISDITRSGENRFTSIYSVYTKYPKNRMKTRTKSNFTTVNIILIFSIW